MDELRTHISFMERLQALGKTPEAIEKFLGEQFSQDSEEDEDDDEDKSSKGSTNGI
ncbi:hypothetical protein PtB15_1B892 [Puccinia triticina]|nr:hypothetical protein PtB15_1B892 [Puccinia triticina]